MDIVIVAQYLRDIECLEGNNSRFIYLAGLLAEKSCNQVEIITSNFNHGKKESFNKIDQSKPFKITALDEPGYSKNVCLKRFYSHNILSKNIKRYLENRKKPDSIYCAIPSLDVAKVVSDYCKAENVRFIIDIQDLWPEAFKMVFHLPILSDFIFKPMDTIANKIYWQADEIVAVSKTYCERAMKVNKKCTEVHTVFLGTKLEDFDANVRNFDVEKIDVNISQKNAADLWLAYCGTLGSSYDLTCVFDALEIVKKQGVIPPTFIVMGDGPRRVEFERYASEKNVDVIFTGSLPYAQMCGLLCMCDITVNPIMHGAAQSIINKHADYVASGLPVVNTQECEEYRSLVENYNMGLNCKNNDAVDLAEKMMRLIKDKQLREEMGINARRCAEEKFNRKYIYKGIIELIENDK